MNIEIKEQIIDDWDRYGAPDGVKKYFYFLDRSDFYLDEINDRTFIIRDNSDVDIKSFDNLEDALVYFMLLV